MDKIIIGESGPNTDRFKDLSWAKVAHEKVIMLGGLGGIGSWTALFLSRAGFIVKGFDFDTVEVHNLGGQLFTEMDIHGTKASSITNVINQLVPGNRFEAYALKLQFDMESNPVISPYVVTGFDNMKARKGMFMAWCEMTANNKFGSEKEPFFIDGRMRAEGFQLYFVRNNDEDIKKYIESLFDDKDVPDEICTIKATSHVGALIATLITAAAANHFADQDIDPRVIPFKTTVDLELFNFNVE